VCALVIIGDHDWRRRARAYDSPLVVDHLEMDIESNFLAVMPTIACNAHGKDYRPSGEVEFLWTVELEQTERSIRSFRGFLSFCLHP